MLSPGTWRGCPLQSWDKRGSDSQTGNNEAEHITWRKNQATAFIGNNHRSIGTAWGMDAESGDLPVDRWH